MGLANAVVPDDKLDEEVDASRAELAERSSDRIGTAKKSFNADTDHIRGIGGLGMQGPVSITTRRSGAQRKAQTGNSASI